MFEVGEIVRGTRRHLRYGAAESRVLRGVGHHALLFTVASLQSRGQIRGLVAPRRSGRLSCGDVERPGYARHPLMLWRSAKCREGVVVEVRREKRGIGV